MGSLPCPTSAIDFYFDFASPYAYLASHRVDEIGARHGRAVTWRPVMLGAMFKAAGTGPIVNYPLKGPYAANDLARSARLIGVSVRFPGGFPHATLAAARGFYWLMDTEPGKAKPFAHAFFAAYFGEGRDASPAGETAKIAASVGVDEAVFLEAVQDVAIKDRAEGRDQPGNRKMASSAHLLSSSMAKRSGAPTGSIRSSAGSRQVAGDRSR